MGVEGGLERAGEEAVVVAGPINRPLYNQAKTFSRTMVVVDEAEVVGINSNSSTKIDQYRDSKFNNLCSSHFVIRISNNNTNNTSIRISIRTSISNSNNTKDAMFNFRSNTSSSKIRTTLFPNRRRF